MKKLSQLEKYKKALEIAVDALILYADPSSYHAILIMPDRPSGWFADDLGLVPYSLYNRKMHGKKARAALDKMRKVLNES